MATPTPSPQGEWIPKAEAAELLGVSTREIERKAAAGRIRTNKVRLEGDRSDRTVYSVDDVQRVKQEREAGVMQLAPRGLPPAPEANPVFAALAGQLLRNSAPRIEKPWLSLDEAAEYSGLPQTMLASALRAGGVYALGRGPKTWRVQRSSLDKWSASDRPEA